MRARVALGKFAPVDDDGNACRGPRSKNTMNITTCRARYTLASMLALAIVGCGGDPCLPTINADTLIAPAAPVEECLPGYGSSTTAAEMCPAPIDVDAPTCAGTPADGTAWGRCFIGETCDDGLSCRTTSIGAVCVPACDDCGCPAFNGCFGGTCNGADSCVPECSDADDVCPGDGMICDTEAGLCVYPALATEPMCKSVDGTNGGPCTPEGECDDGLTCRSTATSWVCVEPCGENNECSDVVECAATLPACVIAEGLCANWCAGHSDCMLGQTCTVFGCEWPHG